MFALNDSWANRAIGHCMARLSSCSAGAALAAVAGLGLASIRA